MIKASFVLPVKNGEKFIEKTLQSLRNQTMKEIEIVVVNDYSTDNTAKIVQSICQTDNRVKLFNNPKDITGEAATRNFGTKLAHGKIILPTDADDPNVPNRAEISFNELKKNKADIFYGTLMHYNIETGKREKRFFQPYDARLLKNINFINHAGASAYWKKTFEKIGGYDPAIVIGTDYDMWLNAQEKEIKFCGQDIVLAQYTIHPGQMTATNIPNRQKWLRIIREKHNILELDLEYVKSKAKSQVVDFFVNNPYYFEIWFSENSLPKKI